MNIEAANLSMSSGVGAVGSGTDSSLAKSALGNVFADTFKEQLKQSKMGHDQAEMPRRDSVESKKIQSPNDAADQLQEGGSGDEELAALLGAGSSSDKTTVELEPALAALTGALKPAEPNEDGATDKASQQNIGGMVVFSGLPFVTPPAEQLDPGCSDGGISLDNILQNKGVFVESVKSAQETGLPSLDSAKPVEKTGLTDQLPGPEANAPSGISFLHRSVDNKTEFTVISRPLTHPGWSKDLGEHIVWLYNKAIPSAEITLNPEHLGPISVRIDVNQDQTSILFTAQHAVVKEALEASIPRLREMLNSQQLNLVDVNVSQHLASNQHHSSPQEFARSSEQWEQKAESGADVIEPSENGQTVAVKGLLNLYA